MRRYIQVIAMLTVKLQDEPQYEQVTGMYLVPADKRSWRFWYGQIRHDNPGCYFLIRSEYMEG